MKGRIINKIPAKIFEKVVTVVKDLGSCILSPS
jgi:hypothetical protein